MKLYNEDCLIVMKNIPDESIDLVVTDCPYHIIGSGGSKNKKGNPTGILNRDTSSITINGKKQKVVSGTKHVILGGVLDDQSVYVKQGKLFKHNDIKFEEWLPELYRVLKKDTHVYIYINSRNLKELQQKAEEVGFKFQQLIIWDKGNSTPNKYYLNSYECVLMLRKGKAKNINNMGCKNILRIPNIIGNKTHPTEKPVELNKILIENSSNVGDVVLDPFMGTGSSGLACKELNRNFIGVEIDEKYYNIAKERLI